MHDIDLTDEEAAQLAPYYFDRILQERLCQLFRSGRLSSETNRIRGEILLPPPGMIRDLPDPADAEGHAAHLAGAAAATRGKLALLVLNGGMATRFGGGVKGTVPVVDGLSFVGLKITAARLLAAACGGAVPVYLMNSISTHKPTLRHLEEHDYFGYEPALILPFLQNTLLRLTPDGGLFRHGDGTLSPYGPGHGDIVEAVARSVLPDMESRGIEVVQVSNVDNVLATPDPLCFGVHLLDGAEMTIEVVSNTGTDVGGGPLIVDGVFQIVEGFRLPPSFDLASLADFNANTLYFSQSCFRRNFDLSWFVVHKNVQGREALQFERLAGQISAYSTSSCRRVPREGPHNRFSPIKDRTTLEQERDRILLTLRSRGFLPGKLQ